MEQTCYIITNRKRESYKEPSREKAMEAYSVKKFHVVEVKRTTIYTEHSAAELIVSTQIRSFKDFS